MQLQENELANLQRSLRSLSGPAQPLRPAQAMPNRLPGPLRPDSGSTGVFCRMLQQQQQQQRQQFPRGDQRTGRAPLGAGPTAQQAAAPAPMQQPLPASSLIDATAAQESQGRARQIQIPQARPMLQPSALLQWNRGQPEHNAGSYTSRVGGLHTQPANASRQWNVPSNTLVHHAPQAHTDATNASKPSQQRVGAPPHSQRPTTPQLSPGAAKAAPQASTCPRQQTQMHGLQSPGTANTHVRSASRTQQNSLAALSKAVTKQPADAGHPAMSPALEPAPYTVQEPDSPSQEHAEGAQVSTRKHNRHTAPTCIYTETTITRCLQIALPGKSALMRSFTRMLKCLQISKQYVGARVATLVMLRDCRTVTPGSSSQTQSTWTIREVHQAGGGPGQQAGLAGIFPGASVAKHSRNHRLPFWIKYRLKM